MTIYSNRQCSAYLLIFDELVSCLEELKGASILQERDLLRTLLEPVSDDNLPFLVSSLAGSKQGGGHVTTEVAKIAISRAYGSPIEQVERTLREVGNLPAVAEVLSERRQQKVIASESHDVIDVLGELQKLLTSQISNKYKPARIANLLIDSSPDSSRVVLEILLGQASAYVRKSVLTDYIVSRFDVDQTTVRELVELRGWYGSVEELLLGSSKGIVGRPGDGEECRKGSAEEGDAQSER
jgi:hypothetical protein